MIIQNITDLMHWNVNLEQLIRMYIETFKSKLEKKDMNSSIMVKVKVLMLLHILYS